MLEKIVKKKLKGNKKMPKQQEKINSLYHDTKKKILHIAARLFSERGYSQVSVREICELAEIGKPTLYYYFKDKQTLFLKLIEESRTITNKLVDEFIISQPEFKRQFHGLFRLHLEYLKKHSNFVRFFFVVHFMSLDQNLKNEVIEQSKEYLQKLQEFIKKGQKEGHISSELPVSTISLAIFGSIRYFMLYHLQNIDTEFDVERELEELYQFWVNKIFLK